MKKNLKYSFMVILLFFSGVFLSNANLSVQAAPQKSDSHQTLLPGTLRDFQFLTPNSGWVLIENELHFTKDSGRSWRNITPNLSGDIRAVIPRRNALSE